RGVVYTPMQLRRILWISTMVLAASALAGVGAPALIRADNGDPAPGTLSVVGTGIVKTEPDTATTSFGVSTQGATAEEAMSENSRAMAKVIDALQHVGISGKDLQTQYLSLNPR